MGEDVAQRPPGGGAQRLDKWLWYARVVKTRSLAAALVTRGRVRVNRERIQKPSQTVKPGDVITASVSRDMRVLKVLLPGTRRGPASEAQTLYEDLSPVKIAGPSAGGGCIGGSIEYQRAAGGRCFRHRERPTEQERAPPNRPAQGAGSLIRLGLSFRLPRSGVSRRDTDGGYRRQPLARAAGSRHICCERDEQKLFACGACLRMWLQARNIRVREPRDNRELKSE